MDRKKVARRTVFLAIALLSPATLHAGGFMVARFGGEHGNPMDSNPTSIYYNPAGLAGIDGWQLYLEGDLAFRTLSYDRSVAALDGASHDADYIAAISGKGGLTNTLAAPFLGVASNFGIKGLGVGLAFYVPFGGEATFDKHHSFDDDSKFPGAVDGPQRYQDIEGTIRSLYLSAAGAYRFPFGLSVGVTLSGVRNEINDIKAFNADGTDNLLTGTGGVNEGRAWVKVDNLTVAVGVGVQYTPPSLPELTIGLSYQSQPGFGKTTLKGNGKIKLGTASEITPKVHVEQSLPDVIRLGLSYRVMKRLELRLWGAFERWSTFKSQCFFNPDTAGANCAIDDRGQTGSQAVVISNIPRHWKNVVNGRISGSYWVSPGLEVMLGFGYDGSAVPDETMMVDLPDFNNIEINAGARYQMMEKLKLYLGFSQFVYFDRTVDPGPRDGSGNRTVYTPPSRQPDNAGDYHESVSLIQLGVAYSF